MDKIAEAEAMVKAMEAPLADEDRAALEAYVQDTEDCPHCSSHGVGRKGDEYYYWMFQCCLLAILSGVGVWVHYVFNGLSIQGIINDVLVPMVWTWLAIFLFDLFR